MNTIPEWTDVFNNQIGDRTNVLDLAAHYPYNPERWRLFVDGSRKFPEYNSVSQYNHATDRHELSPAAGERVTFESAERPRYVVQYELASTFAFELSQSLTRDGDVLKIGLYDGSDGWYLEHNGDHPDDSTVDVVMERNGSEVYRKSDKTLQRPLTKFSRLRLQTGWYDVTRQRWEQSFPRDGDQVNDTIIETDAADSQGPQTGNLPICYELQADANSSGLTLSAGSAAQVNLGRTTEFLRAKEHTETINLDATGSWVPLLAIRADPDRDIINTQLVDISINEFGTNDDVELTVQAFDPSNVLDSNGNELTDSDYSTAEVFNADNNVLEQATAVEQIADSSGSTSTSVSDPGGFQIGHAILTTGSGNDVTSESTVAGQSKRPIYPRDTAVVLAKSGSTGDVTFTARYEQDW